MLQAVIRLRSAAAAGGGGLSLNRGCQVLLAPICCTLGGALAGTVGAAWPGCSSSVGPYHWPRTTLFLCSVRVSWHSAQLPQQHHAQKSPHLEPAGVRGFRKSSQQRSRHKIWAASAPGMPKRCLISVRCRAAKRTAIRAARAMPPSVAA